MPCHFELYYVYVHELVILCKVYDSIFKLFISRFILENKYITYMIIYIECKMHYYFGIVA